MTRPLLYIVLSCVLFFTVFIHKEIVVLFKVTVGFIWAAVVITAKGNIRSYVTE